MLDFCKTPAAQVGLPLVASFFALLSFSILASDVYTYKVNGYSYTLTYSSWDALCFTVAVGVTLWLWGLVVALVPIGATFDFALCQSAAQKLTGKIVTWGNAISAFLAYTAAIACSSISSNCSDVVGSGSQYQDYCQKMIVSCVFIWFTFLVFAFHTALAFQDQAFGGGSHSLLGAEEPPRWDPTPTPGMGGAGGDGFTESQQAKPPPPPPASADL